MQIEVNEELHDVSSDSLADVLEELGYGDARVATAVDGAFVPASARMTFRLSAGARLEVLAPMRGG